MYEMWYLYAVWGGAQMARGSCGIWNVVYMWLGVFVWYMVSMLSACYMHVMHI